MSEPEASSAKKRRLETGGKESPSQQDPDFWFDDGNIVLVAGDVGFKVHRGVLARQATMFKDMFEVSHPQVDEMMGNCPVVNLHDTTQELRFFLRILYDGFQNRKFPSWAALRAVVLLSHKYGADAIQKGALQVLQLDFPRDLMNWTDQRKLRSSRRMLYDPVLDCISAANLARTLELTQIHAIALYDCCQLPGENLIMGIGNGEVLAPEDLVRCVDGTRWLMSARPQLSEDILTCVVVEGYNCDESIIELLSDLRNAKGTDPQHPPHLAPTCAVLDELTCWKAHAKDYKICSECRRDVLEQVNKHRERCFERLPAKFKLK